MIGGEEASARRESRGLHSMNNEKRRTENPYIRFVLRGARGRRRGVSGNRSAIALIEKTPSELRDLADYFVDLDYRSLLAVFPAAVVASIVESEQIEVVDAARVLLVLSERISRESHRLEKLVEETNREKRNAVRRIRREMKAAASTKKKVSKKKRRR